MKVQTQLAIRRGVVIVAVFGPRGCGKSPWIKSAMAEDKKRGKIVRAYEGEIDATPASLKQDGCHKIYIENLTREECLECIVGRYQRLGISTDNGFDYYRIYRGEIMRDALVLAALLFNAGFITALLVIVFGGVVPLPDKARMMGMFMASGCFLSVCAILS
jgi:hypothetical protein